VKTSNFTDAPRSLRFGGRTNEFGKFLPFSLPFLAAAGIILLPVHPAKAVPAYADQTDLSCNDCHVGGFGPQLTPLGREFKLKGYTMRSRKNIPVSAMAVAGFTHTKKDQLPAPEHFSRNDNVSFDEGSLFLAGGLGRHFGGFAQLTYDGVERHWALDNVDIRAVTEGSLFGEDTVFGLTLNNSPTTQDAWNSTPAWGFPYTDSALAVTPDAAPLIDDALAQNTLGLSAYAWIGQKFYVEAGAYTSPSAGTLRWLGADPADPGDLHGLAPYGRINWQGDLGGGTMEIGAFALKAAINPERDRSSGFTDHYSDIGLDASWQKTLGTSDTLSAQMRYVHEARNLKASCALALIGDGSTPFCAKNHLNELRADVAYTWHNKIGASLGAFSITGDRNPDLYDGPAARPNSNGVTAELDYTPWGDGSSPFGSRLNLRLGVQYTAYGKFNGARHDYDGAGANASDNNALRVFTWAAF